MEIYCTPYIRGWDSDPNALFLKCVHPTLSPEEEHSKKWLWAGGVAHNALHKVALQNTLLRDIKNLTGFHHTGLLEVFHSLLLKYCPKRQHFLAYWDASSYWTCYSWSQLQYPVWVSYHQFRYTKYAVCMHACVTFLITFRQAKIQSIVS